MDGAENGAAIHLRHAAQMIDASSAGPDHRHVVDMLGDVGIQSDTRCRFARTA